MTPDDRIKFKNMAQERVVLLTPVTEGEKRFDTEKYVEGYAAKYDKYLLWDDGDWGKTYERFDPKCFENTDMSDVIMQYDHRGRVFARTRNNTLAVTPDDKGLFIEADLGGTEIGRELYEEIRGGYTDRMSFGFTVNGEYEESQKTDEGVRIYIRHITSVQKLYDVSAVSLPANDGTSIEADATTRSIGNLTDGVIERIQAERLEEQRLELERRRAEVKARALLGGNN